MCSIAKLDWPVRWMRSTDQGDESPSVPPWLVLPALLPGVRGQAGYGAHATTGKRDTGGERHAAEGRRLGSTPRRQGVVYRPLVPRREAFSSALDTATAELV